MKVHLISVTPEALTLLLRTKNTRLGYAEDPATWSEEKRREHLAYMKDTIKSSWEFVDYTFQIEGVTRAFTHQLVRTRTGSFAQESQRTVDVGDHEVLNPFEDEVLTGEEGKRRMTFEAGKRSVMAAYAMLLKDGAKPGDARGILPTNVTTSIVTKLSLRTLHEMGKVRLCTRTQGEYQAVFRAMREAVYAVHPWAEEHGFIEVACVADGTCAFPRYGKQECPVYLPEMDQSRIKLAAKARWEVTRHEASPVAREGKAS